jgi:hypothetical protein
MEHLRVDSAVIEYQGHGKRPRLVRKAGSLFYILSVKNLHGFPDAVAKSCWYDEDNYLAVFTLRRR